MNIEADKKDKDKSLAQVIVELQTNTNYEIQIKTAADSPTNAVDGIVLVTMFGTKAEIVDLFVRNSETNVKDFERGKLDRFFFENLKNIGPMRKLCVKMEPMKDVGVMWKIEYIKIYYEHNCYTFFTPSALFDTKKNVKKFDFQPTLPETDLFRYDLVLQTGTEIGAGTDATVSINIFGMKTNLNKIVFDYKNMACKTKHLLASGQRCRFIFYAKDVGRIKKVEIGHDNKGRGSDWKLNYMIIKINEDLYM